MSTNPTKKTRLRTQTNPTWMKVANMDPRHHTAKAVLVVDDDGEQFWVPKQLIHPCSPVQNADSERGTLIVRGNFAARKGWTGEEYFEEDP